ncbi:MAG: sensor histidine kinase, partial [Polyangiaceae bacterium]
MSENVVQDPLEPERSTQDALKPERSSDERAALIHLLGRISHDLRGPAGITSGVLDELEQQGNAAQAQLFAMARRGLAGVLRIAERLEMVSQLENGSMQVEPSPVELDDLLKSAVEHASLLQKRKAVRTTIDVPPKLRATCDAHWLRATLIEIIANAIRHAKSSVRV